MATLRRRKHRDERPFAVMAGSLEEIRAYCHVSPVEAELLSSTRRPIVLVERLRRRSRGSVRARPRPLPAASVAPILAPSIAPGVDTCGFFLPYTPLHHLLARAVGRPLIMTSGNVTDEPIAFEDHDAISRLSGLADGFLTHDRPIHARVDDSVARIHAGRTYVLRRSRGWAPLPVTFSGSDSCILAVGGHKKNTFALTRGRHAFLSQHIGDLENLETLRSLEEGVAHYERLFDLRAEVVTHDLHPDYLSTRFAQRVAAERSIPLVAVQHHEAHVASVLADSGHSGPVVGVAFDGSGYGPDGTIWGGEFFVGSPGTLTRVARLGHLPLPGGEAAVREPWRMGLALLHACGLDPETALAPVTAFAGTETLLARPWEFMRRLIDSGVNSPLTSSAGRLFDAVAALLSVRMEVSYEGQAAIMLETAARRHFAAAGLPEAATTPDWLNRGDWAMMEPRGLPRVVPLEPFALALVYDLAHNKQPGCIAARFHHALAWITAREAAFQADRHSLDTVALGGGVFQNTLFLELLTSRLRRVGLSVLVHRAVPTNDGGLCLGQAETAAALLRAPPPSPPGRGTCYRRRPPRGRGQNGHGLHRAALGHHRASGAVRSRRMSLDIVCDVPLAPSPPSRPADRPASSWKPETRRPSCKAWPGRSGACRCSCWAAARTCWWPTTASTGSCSRLRHAGHDGTGGRFHSGTGRSGRVVGRTRGPRRGRRAGRSRVPLRHPWFGGRGSRSEHRSVRSGGRGRPDLSEGA